MNSTLKLLIILFGTNISGQAQPITTIPFTIEKNCIYIYCQVNETDSLKFLFDTGANGSLITDKANKKLRLQTNGTNLNIGSNGANEELLSSNNEVMINNIRKKASFTIGHFEEPNFDGIFGIDLMKGHLIEIDYGKEEIRFYEEQDTSLNFKDYVQLKLSLINDYPAVVSSLNIDGVSYSGLFGLDTGADDALTIAAPYATNNNLKEKMKQIGSAGFQGSDGSSYEMPIVMCPEIEFSDKFFYRVPVALSAAKEGIDATDQMAGFYGNNFLKRFDTILDLKNGFIYFKLNKNLYTKFY